ncbi:MAG: hypothetical protein ACI9J3_000031 [Parvicellaceae bacterium]|jgi:hypothetical protein
MGVQQIYLISTYLTINRVFRVQDWHKLRFLIANGHKAMISGLSILLIAKLATSIFSDLLPT